MCWGRDVGVAGSPCSQLLMPKDDIVHFASGTYPLALEQPPAGRASPVHTELPFLTKEDAFDAFQVCNVG